MIIKLGRMVGEEEVEYLIPVMEAKFTIVDETTGFINWDNEDFDVDLTEERIQTKWNEWIAFKSEASSQIMDKMDVVDFVKNLVQEGLKQTQQAHQDEIEQIRAENVAASEKVRQENDTRTEKIRGEYFEVQEDLTKKMTTMVETVSTLATNVKNDMETINKSAINMTDLKSDLGDVTKLLTSILDADA